MQVPEQRQFQKRSVAFKASISSILKADFAKDEVSSGYVKINNLSASRVSIMATLVYKSENNHSAIIDDGTGRISLKSFENGDIFDGIEISDAVLAIGKVREFNNERYILPEVIKKISVEWMSVRKLELKNIEENKDSGFIDNDRAAGPDAHKDLYELIKRLDDGNGVAVEDLLKRHGSQNTEGIINKLLENGDVFEIKPGKIKVLE